MLYTISVHFPKDNIICAGTQNCVNNLMYIYVMYLTRQGSKMNIISYEW